MSFDYNIFDKNIWNSINLRCLYSMFILCMVKWRAGPKDQVVTEFLPQLKTTQGPGRDLDTPSQGILGILYYVKLYVYTSHCFLILGRSLSISVWLSDRQTGPRDQVVTEFCPNCRLHRVRAWPTHTLSKGPLGCAYVSSPEESLPPLLSQSCLRQDVCLLHRETAPEAQGPFSCTSQPQVQPNYGSREGRVPHTDQ